MAAKRLVVANWKMNPPTFREAKLLFEATKKVRVVVAPPAIFLRELAGAYRGKKVAFAAQSAHFEAGGAHTGELSMKQARDAKASYVLVGHAERRASGETNDDTRKKITAAFAHSLTPIFCIGEHVRASDGSHFSYIREQLTAGPAES